MKGIDTTNIGKRGRAETIGWVEACSPKVAEVGENVHLPARHICRVVRRY